MIMHHYNPLLVVISVAVAIVSSYTALTLSQRMIIARQSGKWHLNWLLASAGVLGVGIWSMHFVAMLAYVVDLEVHYRVDLTLLSVVCAIAGSVIGFWFVNRKRTVGTVVAAGSGMGLAICSMHYTGMAAYHTGVTFDYDPLLVGVSIAIAIGASTVALWTIFRLTFSRWVQMGAAVILGTAISGMHYTGMAALTMEPDYAVLDPHSYAPLLWTFNTNYLTVITVGVIAAITVISFIMIAHNEQTFAFMARESKTLRYANKMEAIGHLTGGIAHDFRNVLTVMRSGVQLLERGRRIEEVAPLMEQTLTQGQFLVEQLLSFARQRPLNPQRVLLSELLQKTQLLLSKALPANIALEINIHEDLTVNVEAEACSLALMNLVINARDALPNGGLVEISVDRESVDNRLHFLYSTVDRFGTFAHICVKDNGTGMTPEVIDRLFEPFFTTKAEGKGSGLGLPQVHGFVQQSDGGIGIVSQLDKGTQVHILLPL